MPLVAYVDVCLEHPRFERPFLEEIESLLDVQECCAISGDFGYRLKVRARTSSISSGSSGNGSRPSGRRQDARRDVPFGEEDSTLLALVEGA